MISGFGIRDSRHIVAALVLAAAWPSAGCAQAMVVHDTITADGVLREFYFVMPPRVDTGHPAALVFFFHGGGSSALEAYRGYGFAGVAGAAGAITVYPEGINHHWNDDRDFFPGPDDYAFVSAMVTRLVSHIRIDPRRVYAVGHSNGGIFANSAACHLPLTFAAIAGVGGPLARNGVAGCRTMRPVSVIEIQGVADPVLPYAGGTITGNRGNVLGADSTVAFWAAADGCAPTPVRTPLAPLDPADPTRITKVEFRSCRDGRSVVLYSIAGGGHRWPGGVSSQPDSIVGPPTKQLDATRVIWEFFAAHPSP